MITATLVNGKMLCIQYLTFLLTNCVDGFWGSCSPKFVDCTSISFSLCHVTSPDNLSSRRSMSISRAKVVLTLGLMLSSNGISLVDTIFVIPWSQRLSIWVSSTFLQGVVRAQGRRNLFGWLNLFSAHSKSQTLGEGFCQPPHSWMTVYIWQLIFSTQLCL